MLCKFLNQFYCDSERYLAYLITQKDNIDSILKSLNKLSIGCGCGLEEVDQCPSINVSFLPVPQLVKINNFFGLYIQGDCFKKPLNSLYPCHQTIEKEEQ